MPLAGLRRSRFVWRILGGSVLGALLVGFAARWLLASVSVVLQPERVATVLPGASSVLARLERELGPAGRERLRGETRFDVPHSGVFALVSEDVEFDGEGRLERAQVRVVWRHRSAPEASAVLWSELTSFDVLAGLRVSQTDQGRTQTRRIETDLPWAYLPLATPAGEALSTPVAAIVAEHAAAISTAVRWIDPLGHDLSLASDQLLVPDAGENLVVLGDDLAVFMSGEPGRGDLLRLHVAALDLDLIPR